MTDTATYKQQLEAEKASLIEELQTIARPNDVNPDIWEAIEVDGEREPDPNDQAHHLDEYQENHAIVDVLNARYQNITAALNRIEDGTYGVCTVCNGEIEAARLAADPTATTCTIHISE